MVNTEVRLICNQRWRSSIQSAKTRLGAGCASDHELLIVKFRLKLKKVVNTTRPFRYVLNQIPYNHTLEGTNRFKGLDLIEYLKNYGWRFMTGGSDQDHPQGVQFSSVPQSCPTLCDPVDCSTPGLPVHHQLLELAQTHVHRVGDAIQPSHPLSSPSPAFSLSQLQGLFQWVSSSHQAAKVLEFQLQHQSFQWTPRTDLL